MAKIIFENLSIEEKAAFAPGLTLAQKRRWMTRRRPPLTTATRKRIGPRPIVRGWA